jgi:NTE family protein
VDAATGASPPRPRIGLVLGGGGAKGAAHVGVLRVLDEMRIPIDCVAGTSMGALVGGTYAAGTSAVELEQAVRAISSKNAIAFEGQCVKDPMRRKLSGVTDFDRLPIRFRAVATDMRKGEMAVLDQGSLARAMRASMSVPSPVPTIEELQSPLTMAGRTPLGPVTMTLAGTSEGDWQIMFDLGRPIQEHTIMDPVR